MAGAEGLYTHLESGTTTVCRAWAIERVDGAVFGFTDHDRDFTFEGIAFRADTGLTARALQQTTGLSVDNSEAIGALSAAAVTEVDLLAGRYDGAKLRGWLVNWTNPDERILQFRGSLGEIVRAGGAFQAELRGLTEALNQPQGRAYQRGCSAVLGDRQCRFDLTIPGFAVEAPVETVEGRRVFHFGALTGFDDRWFEKGRLIVKSGLARSVVGVIKNDRLTATGRAVELWQALGPEIAVGDTVRLEAGCDRSADTCRFKFTNFLNFRGFPHIPGEDWLTSFPASGGMNDGGSLVR